MEGVSGSTLYSTKLVQVRGSASSVDVGDLVEWFSLFDPPNEPEKADENRLLLYLTLETSEHLSEVLERYARVKERNPRGVLTKFKEIVAAHRDDPRFHHMFPVVQTAASIINDLADELQDASHELPNRQSNYDLPQQALAAIRASQQQSERQGSALKMMAGATVLSGLFYGVVSAVVDGGPPILANIIFSNFTTGIWG